MSHSVTSDLGLHCLTITILGVSQLKCVNIWTPQYLRYYDCPKISKSPFCYLFMCLNIAGWMADSADPDDMIHSAVYDLDQNCLHRPVCPNK